MPELNDWVTLTVNAEYEINLDPIQIRHKETLRVVRPFTRKDNYKPVKLGTRLYYLHKIIALQFIKNPDPENYIMIDHIDRNRLNNSVDNLRFVSPSQNNRNKKSHRGRVYNYVQNLPEGAVEINPFPNLRDTYYQAGNKIYVNNLVNYRELYIDKNNRVNLAIVSQNGRTKYKKYKIL
jgi:hypothetical protein